MLNSSQRARLRGMANSLDTILQVGKGGITDNVVSQASDALTARELIKGRVLDSSMLSAREAADELARLCGAETVFTIGSRFVLYRESREIPKEKRLMI
ncbi:MAG: YhbY family RNA-binding protein [Clostridiales bacterium]|nr:YhbY family RNA-binding protein [Clostridiales bacterium]